MIIHWRLGLGLIVGAAVWAGCRLLGLAGAAAGLIAWNAGAAAYLLAAWVLFLRAGETEVRLRAARLDERRAVVLTLSVVAIAASLAGIIASLISVKGDTANARALVAALAALTLVISWAVLQSVFLAHYAHRHFQSLEAHGPAGGFLFPGDPPRTYLDFAYLAVCVGATAQVSDPGVQTTALRNLVTAHAVTSFFYNTAVLALGINILSGLLGH